MAYPNTEDYCAPEQLWLPVLKVPPSQNQAEMNTTKKSFCDYRPAIPA
jgi:hypothetical protein